MIHQVAALLDGARIPRLLPAKGPMIVMYHGLGGSDGVRPADFEAQLDLLRSQRTVVPLSELFAAIDEPRAVDLAAITFDDGYVDFAELAVPALRQRGLHATLFVPAGRIGESNVWDEGKLPSRRIMDADALRSLDTAVVEIGGHGFSHCRMTGLTPAELELETKECRRVLETTLDRPVTLFAYPYGQRDDFDAAAEAGVAAAGFVLACSTCFGRSNQSSSRYRLRRVGIEHTDDLTIVARKFRGAYDWIGTKEQVGALLRGLRARSARGG